MCRFIFVSAADLNAGDKKNKYMTNLSTRLYLEYLHCYLLWIFFSKNKIRKNDPIFILIRILIILIYANMHVTIT